MSDITLDAVVDQNEVAHCSPVKELLEDHEDIGSVTVEDLPEGDAVIGSVAFERKRPDDYVGSIMDGRHKKQGTNIARYYDNSYLLFEGTLAITDGKYWSGMTGKSIRASMASLIVRPDIGYNAIIASAEPDILIDMAVHIARMHEYYSGVSDTEPDSSSPTANTNSAVPAYIPDSDASPSADSTTRMYGCLPGVGNVMATRLATAYPNISDLVDVIRDDSTSLQDIDGIGSTLEQRIIEEVVGSDAGGDDTDNSE